MIKPIALLLLSPLALRSQVAIDLPLPSIAVAATVSVEKTVDHLYFFSGYKPADSTFARIAEIAADTITIRHLEQALATRHEACRPVQLTHHQLSEQQLFDPAPNLYFICGFVSPNEQTLIARLGKRRTAGEQVNEWVCQMALKGSSWIPAKTALPQYEVLASILAALTPPAWEALYNPSLGLEEYYHAETLLANERVHTPFPGRRIDLTRLSSLLAHIPPDQLLSQIKRYHMDGSRALWIEQHDEQK